MEIKLLENDPALVRTIAEWHQAEWGHLSDRTTEDRIAEFAEHVAGGRRKQQGAGGRRKQQGAGGRRKQQGAGGRHKQQGAGGRHKQQGTQVPLTLVGLLDGAPIGTASLLTEDMDIHKNLSPWLASVFVLPEHRGQGHGTRLVKEVVARGERLGVPSMYLFTEDRAGFYEAMGWQVLETRPYHGETVTIMTLDLAR